jgi:predicted xylose isomerase-like sugar epimerase
LIGSITQTCRMAGIQLILQGAKIKERAEAAGAKALFMSPLDENRHANDAIRHGVYYQAVERGAVAVQGMDEDEQTYEEV